MRPDGEEIGRAMGTTYDVPSSMDALVLLGPDEYEVREAPVPEPARHEVLCEVHSVAICGTDTELIAGHFLKKGWPPGYPYTPGHEWSANWRPVLLVANTIRKSRRPRRTSSNRRALRRGGRSLTLGRAFCVG